MRLCFFLKCDSCTEKKAHQFRKLSFKYVLASIMLTILNSVLTELTNFLLVKQQWYVNKIMQNICKEYVVKT